MRHSKEVSQPGPPTCPQLETGPGAKRPSILISHGLIQAYLLTRPQIVHNVNLDLPESERVEDFNDISFGKTDSGF